MEKKRLKMKRIDILLITCLAFFIIISCKKDDSNIDRTGGYPQKLVGNWVVFEFPGAEIGDILYDPYDLVTALDPNNEGVLVLDKLYASDVRVRAIFDSASFKVEMGRQLDTVSTNTYDIAYISLEGSVSQSPVIINTVYNFAVRSFDNIAFSRRDIKDVILIHAGFYDKYKYPIDTVLIMGYRKTGFENVDIKK
jgi:hypothetical protein